MNAYRNGFNGQIVCSSPEELVAFKSFCSEIQTELAPVGAIERFYAKSISENMYRLERARSLEMGMFSNGHRDHVDEMQSGHPEADTALAASRTFLEQAHEFHLLTGYEVKILRALEKHQAHLKAIQAARKAAHEVAVEQATQFVELAEAMEETYEPGEDFTPASAHGGFVFSQTEIDRRRVRAAHLRAARIYHFDGKLPKSASKPNVTPRSPPHSLVAQARGGLKYSNPSLATSHARRVPVRQASGLSIPTKGIWLQSRRGDRRLYTPLQGTQPPRDGSPHPRRTPV